MTEHRKEDIVGVAQQIATAEKYVNLLAADSKSGMSGFRALARAHLNKALLKLERLRLKLQMQRNEAIEAIAQEIAQAKAYIKHNTTVGPDMELPYMEGKIEALNTAINLLMSNEEIDAVEKRVAEIGGE